MIETYKANDGGILVIGDIDDADFSEKTFIWVMRAIRDLRSEILGERVGYVTPDLESIRLLIPLKDIEKKKYLAKMPKSVYDEICKKLYVDERYFETYREMIRNQEKAKREYALKHGNEGK